MCKSQTWHTVGLGVNGSTMAGPTVNGISYFNGKITIGGYFTKSGTTVLNGVGQWDGNQWQPMGTGIFDNIMPPGNSGIAHDFLIFKDTLYLSGSFTSAGRISATDTTHDAANIARWYGSAWHPMTHRGDGFYGGAGPQQIYNNDLFIGGGFAGYMDTTYYLPTTAIAKWNDSVVSAIGNLQSNHPSGDDYVQDLCVYNNKLIEGGVCNSINASPYGSFGYIASYNDTIWDSLGSGLNNVVYSLTVYDGDLYAGGIFTATGDNATLLNPNYALEKTKG